MPTVQDLIYNILYIYISVTSLADTVLCHRGFMETSLSKCARSQEQRLQ